MGGNYSKSSLHNNIICPDNGKTYTSGSQLYLYAQADDIDGTLDWVRFYVNGLPYGNPIPAYLGKATANYLWYKLGSSSLEYTALCGCYGQ